MGMPRTERAIPTRFRHRNIQLPILGSNLRGQIDRNGLQLGFFGNPIGVAVSAATGVYVFQRTVDLNFMVTILRIVWLRDIGKVASKAVSVFSYKLSSGMANILDTLGIMILMRVTDGLSILHRTADFLTIGNIVDMLSSIPVLLLDKVVGGRAVLCVAQTIQHRGLGEAACFIREFHLAEGQRNSCCRGIAHIAHQAGCARYSFVRGHPGDIQSGIAANTVNQQGGIVRVKTRNGKMLVQKILHKRFVFRIIYRIKITYLYASSYL